MAKVRVDRKDVKSRVEKKIKRASQLSINQNFLIYGYPDAGKTRVGATAPKCLVVDVNEQGTDSVRRDIDPYVYPVEFWQEVNDVYWYALSGEHDYESFCVDGLTGLQTLCMKFVLGDEASRDASRDPDMPSRAIYGKVGELMKTQITNWRNLPYNTIFTALARTRDAGEGEDEEVLITGPNLSPAIASHATAAVGTIGYLMKREVVVKSKQTKKSRKEIRRRLLVGPHERYITKDRNGLFGAYVDAPDLSEMLEAIKA